MRVHHWGLMIKRAGVEVMNARTKNVSIAKETLEIVRLGKYVAPSGKEVDIKAEVEFSKSLTAYWEPDSDIFSNRETIIQIFPTIEVTNETTAQAAARLLAAGIEKPVALNFASARNQGGGFLSGAVAQEEDLCRCSALYDCLKKKPLFYNKNILQDDTFYTDGIIYSPQVPFFRDQNLNFLEEPFKLSIISVPAPNVRAMEEVDGKKLAEVLNTRATKILKVALLEGHKNLILGAWGCGAFGNDPGLVAEAFRNALLNVPAFERVTFAVYDTREPPVLYETFKQIYNIV